MLKSALTFLVPSGIFRGEFFIYLYFLEFFFLRKKINVKNFPTVRLKRPGSRDCKNNSKLRREFNLSRYWNLSYFHTQANNDDAIKRILAAARAVLSTRRVRHLKLVLALVSTETAS